LPYQVLSWPNSVIDSAATFALSRHVVAAEFTLLTPVSV
jgi:hypothetical protein